jgi:hypothetical protein
MAVGALIHRIATNIWIASSRSIFPDDSSFQWAFLPLLPVNDTNDTITHTSNVLTSTNSAGAMVFSGGLELQLSNDPRISTVRLPGRNI